MSSQQNKAEHPRPKPESWDKVRFHTLLCGSVWGAPVLWRCMGVAMWVCLQFLEWMGWVLSRAWGLHGLFPHSCALVVIWGAYSFQHHPVLTPKAEESMWRRELRLFRTTLQRQESWGSSAWRVCFPVSGHSEGLQLGMLFWEAWTNGFPLNSGFQEKGNVWERNCLAGTCLVFWDGKGVREDQVMQAHCPCWGCSGKTRRRRKRVPSKAASFP